MYNTMPFMGEDIRVLIREKSLHIENTESLRRVLKKKHAPFKLAQYLKQQHTNQFHTVLNISDKSLTIEIIGHVYIGNFADTLKEIPRIPKIAPIIVKKRIKLLTIPILSTVGEVDSNRWVWINLLFYMIRS